MRAARAVLSELDPTACTQPDYEGNVQALAALIDREAAVLELAAACQRLMAVVGAYLEIPETHHGWACAIQDQARAALRKAGVE
jgi:hypothetical protein